MPHARTLALIAAFATTTLAAPVPNPADEPEPAPQKQPTPRLEQDLLEAVQRVTLGEFWGAIVVRVDGQDVLRRGFGFEDATLTPIDPGVSLFDIGSVAKPFTAATILSLVDTGDLELTTTLHEVFPNDNLGVFDDTTIEELLTHRWGVVFPEAASKTDFTHIDAIPFVLASAKRTHPRGQYAYSNFGYFTLAAVIEQTAKESFETTVWRRVINPAGLKHTGFVGDTSIEGARPTARIASRGAPSDTLNYPWNWAQRGATGVVTTADDVARWIETIVQSDLLQPDTRQAMLTPVSPEAGLGYALGWEIEQHPDQTLRRIGHTGSTAGYRAALGHYPAVTDEDVDQPAVTIVVLTNERTNPVILERALARIAAPQKPKPTIADLYLINYPNHQGIIERAGNIFWDVLAVYQGRSVTGEPIIENRPTIILNDADAAVWAAMTAVDHADARDLATKLETAADRAAKHTPHPSNMSIRIDAAPYQLDGYQHASLPNGSRWIITTDAGTVIATLTDADTKHAALTARMPPGTARNLAAQLRAAAD